MLLADKRHSDTKTLQRLDVRDEEGPNGAPRGGLMLSMAGKLGVTHASLRSRCQAQIPKMVGGGASKPMLSGEAAVADQCHRTDTPSRREDRDRWAAGGTLPPRWSHVVSAGGMRIGDRSVWRRGRVMEGIGEAFGRPPTAVWTNASHEESGEGQKERGRSPAGSAHSHGSRRPRCDDGAAARAMTVCERAPRPGRRQRRTGVKGTSRNEKRERKREVGARREVMQTRGARTPAGDPISGHGGAEFRMQKCRQANNSRSVTGFIRRSRFTEYRTTSQTNPMH